MKLTWDPDAGRYRRLNGRALTPTEVRVALDRDAVVLANRAAELAEQLRSGALAIDRWRDEMRELIKQTHISATAMAVGGRAQATFTDWGRAGQLIRTEYQHLDGWVVEIVSGEAPLDGRMRTRAALYAQAGRKTYHELERQRMQEDQGATEERSVLHPAEHCGECVEEAEAGWRPIGVMIPIGDRTCGRNCKCTIEYRQAA